MPAGKKKRVTMGDIAKAAGFSRPTVSLALQNSPAVKKQTREAIQKLAKTMGFKRDPAFDVLATQRWSGRHVASFTLGLIIRDIHPEGFIEAVREEAGNLGFGLDVFRLMHRDPTLDFCAMLRDRGIRGIILPSIYHEDEVKDLDFSDFSVVSTGIDRILLPYHTIEADYWGVACRAWDLVIERGYRRIGIASIGKGPQIRRNIFKAVSMMYGQRYASVVEQVPVFQGDFHNSREFLNWYATFRPQAVIGNVMAVPAWLENGGYHIPETVSTVTLASVSNQDRYSYFQESNKDTAERAVRLLDQMIKNQETGAPSRPLKIHTEPIYHDRISLPPADMVL